MNNIPPIGDSYFSHPEGCSNTRLPPGSEFVPNQNDNSVYYDPKTQTFYKNTAIWPGLDYKPMSFSGKTESGYEIYESTDSSGKTVYYEKEPTALYPDTDIPIIYGPFDHNPLNKG